MQIMEILGQVGSILTAIGVLFAVYQWSQAQSFQRLKNLNDVFQEFKKDKEIGVLFQLMDSLSTKIDNGELDDEYRELVQKLSSFEHSEKLRFICYLETIALCADKSQVDAKYAMYLFQWPFVFVFIHQGVSDAFWANFGGSEERQVVKSWGYSLNFAFECHSYMGNRYRNQMVQYPSDLAYQLKQFKLG